MNGYTDILSRFIDIFIAIVLIVLLSEVFIIISIVLFYSDIGSVLFKHKRPGRFGKLFIVYKFKTMKDKYDNNGNTLPDSERLTKIGKFIRAWSLDELPQLFNVLKGDMALVGPRPLLQEYLPLYSDKHKKRHSVLPGITGWSQINGRNYISWKKKLDLDVWYVENKSLKLNLYISYKTIGNILMSKGISHPGSVSMPKFDGNYDK